MTFHFPKSAALFFVLLLLPWLLILASPTLRLMAERQFIGSYNLANNVWPWTPYFIGDEIQATDNEAKRLRLAAQAEPDNVALQLKQNEWYWMWDKTTWQTITHADDEVAQRFPDNALAVANRLRHTTMWLRGNRPEEVQRLKDAAKTTLPPNPTVPVAAPFPAPFVRQPPDLTEAEAAIKAARRGQKLEPNNTFYDWITLYYLLELRRDEEALQVLEGAAQKTDYNAHIYDDMRAGIAARQAIGPVLVEEKWSAALGEIYPHLAPQRNAGRVLMWLASTARQKGDHARALRICDELLRLSAPMVKHPDSIHRHVGIAIASNVFSNFAPVSNLSKTELSDTEYAARQRQTALRFAEYARQNGRADLAAQAPVLAQKNSALLAQTKAQDDQFNKEQSAIFERVFIPWALSRAIVVQLLVLSISTLFFLVRDKTTLQSSCVHQIDLWRLFGILLLAHAFLLAFLWHGAGGVRELAMGGWFDNGPAPDERLKSYISLGFLAFAPLVLGFTITTFVSTLRNIRWRRAHPVNPEETPRLRPAPLGGWNLIGRFWFYGLGAVCVCWWAAVILHQIWQMPLNVFFIEFGLSAFQWTFFEWQPPLIATFLWLCLFALRRPLRPTPWRNYGAFWLRRVLMLWLIAASWTYCGLLVASLPARAQAEVRLQKFLKSES